MANTIKVQDLIVAEGLAILSNELVFTNKINRAYEDKFNLVVQDHRVGTSIRIPKPPKFTVRSGWTRSAQDFTEDNETLSIDTPKGVDCDYRVKKRVSPKYGHHWHIQDVPGRSLILIHIGNTIKDTEGCILVGEEFSVMDGLPAVTNSRATMDMLRQTLPDDFWITVIDWSPE